MKKNENFYSLIVLLAAILWGTTGTAQSFAPSEAFPLSVGSVRLVVGGVALLLWVWKKGNLTDFSLWKNKNTILAAVFISLYQLFFFMGVFKTGVAIGTVVTIGSAPVFAGLISYFFRNEKLEKNWVITTAMAIVGCTLLITGGQAELSLNIFGIVLALGAGASYAMYTSESKNLLEKYNAEESTAVVFFIGALLLSPFLFIYDLKWLWSARGIIVGLHLGIFTTALAFVLFSYGLAKIPFPKAVTISLAEPVTAAFLGVFILKEKLTSISVIGILFVLSGLIILSFSKRKEERI